MNLKKLNLSQSASRQVVTHLGGADSISRVAKVAKDRVVFFLFVNRGRMKLSTVVVPFPRCTFISFKVSFRSWEGSGPRPQILAIPSLATLETTARDPTCEVTRSNCPGKLICRVVLGFDAAELF